MLKHRLITGPLLIVLLIVVVWIDARVGRVDLPEGWSGWLAGRDHLAPGVVLFGLCLIAVCMAATELAAIIRAQQVAAKSWLFVVAAALGLSLTYVAPGAAEGVNAVAAFGLVLAGLFVLTMIVLSRHQTIAGVTSGVGAVLLAFVYLGLLPGFFLALRSGHSVWWIVGVILVTKCADIGAYFTGKSIGKHKLIPWLSPGKTWEGLGGGVVLAALAGAGFAALSGKLDMSHDHVAAWAGALCGVVFALVGLLGDLTVSLMKRAASIKDSSSLLPGLGGVLDVIDSLLLVAPAAYVMLTLLTNGP